MNLIFAAEIRHDLTDQLQRKLQSLENEFIQNNNFSKRSKSIELEVTPWILCQYRNSPTDQQKTCDEKTLNAELLQKTPQSKHFFISPRFGTQSPWASRALNILRIAGNQDIIKLEQIYCVEIKNYASISKDQIKKIADTCADKMTQQIIMPANKNSSNNAELNKLFECLATTENREDPKIPLQEQGIECLNKINQEYGFALNTTEIDYLAEQYKKLKRNPTLAEISMFAQANSEHCRHKIFNAKFIINKTSQENTLFNMIRNTMRCSPKQVVVAYSDNATILKSKQSSPFITDKNGRYHPKQTALCPILKVETHNHPTAIAPESGAATGSGGEIRDEVACGRGGRPIAGLTGFMVSHLHLPNNPQPWEICTGKPDNMASALKIMCEAPIGAARYNNEFGRPNLTGFFRSYCQHIPSDFGTTYRGYHKPIMLAGGIGHLDEKYAKKCNLNAGDLIIVLGGPSMEIGIGGGAASSLAAGAQSADLDFASVQRANPEMQRRAVETVLRCCESETENPILSIHDVGAGGLANAIPEIVHDAEKGAHIELDAIPCADPSMSPMARWCNEAQERFVCVIAAENKGIFTKIAARERSQFAIVGVVTDENKLLVTQKSNNTTVVDLPLSMLLKDLPKPVRKSETKTTLNPKFNTSKLDLSDCIYRVLRYPCVSDKSFLITIGDRSVGGLTARDQMVGPWQVPVADVAITTNDYQGFSGQALATGERTPIAPIYPAASARMAVAEAITNLCAADISDTSEITLSANWMAACNYPGQDAALYEAVEAIGMNLCPALDIAIPVGKDSLSMQSKWIDGTQEKMVTSPVSCIITATAPVADVRNAQTPLLNKFIESELWLIELEASAQSLAGSCLAQTFQTLGELPADINNPKQLRELVKLLHRCRQHKLIHAYHDRSDGGLLITLFEMAFASHCALDINLDELIGNNKENIISSLFNEECGVVVQIPTQQRHTFLTLCAEANCPATAVAKINADDNLRITHKNKLLFCDTRVNCQTAWSSVSSAIIAERDNPICAQQIQQQLINTNDPGIKPHLTTQVEKKLKARTQITLKNPLKIAILREQGVNGQRELAYAFHRAGFICDDVTMSDLIQNPQLILEYAGLAAGGGFSYGDVLGAGRGWAQSILQNQALRAAFKEFFHDKTNFALGICNGCQMLSQLKEIIPDAENFPQLVNNDSQQFESRTVLVRINKTPCIFTQHLEGCVLPVVVAHGEGKAVIENNAAKNTQTATMQYVDNNHQPTVAYPFNPNGTKSAATGFCNADGRISLMMPHPERVTRQIQMSYHNNEYEDLTAWQSMFDAAFNWARSKQASEKSVNEMQV